jgi:VWFA-related protein
MAKRIAIRPATLATMRVCSTIALLPALIALPIVSQTASPAAAAALPPGTAMVVTDVTVQDKSGQPIRGLKASDFQVSENGAPQTIHYFQEHVPSPANAQEPAPMKLTEGEFSNISSIKPGETLNVLLLDALNTPSKDQAFMRQQLLKYAQSAPPGTHLAIFGLSTHLTQLQSFNADPTVLKDAVGHKLIPRTSALLDDSAGKSEAPEAAAENSAEATALAMTSANVAAFEAQNTSLETDLHAQYTLDALNTLAHYLGGFQGRKNLIWFSSSFPIDLLPATSKDDALLQTSTRLSLAQVAVYPVDARSLMGNQAEGGAADQRTAMNALAEDTGGHAISNPTSLADAVQQAVTAGANYYTIAYAPTDPKQDGSLRTMHVALSGNSGAILTYRKGFFAPKPLPPVPAAPAAQKAPATSATSTTASAQVATPKLTPEQEAAQHAAVAYANAAMARGGPAPQDIPFKVRVLPASKTAESAIAPGNELGSYPLPGPYQRFDLDFLALPTSFVFHKEADGSRRGAVEFIAYVYTTDGRLINTTDHTVSVRVPADKVEVFAKEPLQFHLEISSPAKNETYLRIAIRDMIANRFGVVELPAAAVSTLSPPVYQPGQLPPASVAPAKPTVTPGTAPAATSH